MNNDVDLMTVQEFADFARVSAATVRRLCKEGMPSVEIGGRQKVFKIKALNYLQVIGSKKKNKVAPLTKTINTEVSMKPNTFSGENYSGSFDAKTKRWKANIRKPDGKWTTKWCPKEYGVTQGVDAQVFIVGFLKKFYDSWVAPTNDEVIAAKTLAVLIPRWLELRYNSLGTKMSYYKSLRTSARCWILDNPEFPHTSIENLDIQTEVSNIPVLRAWINSLKGKPRTRLSSIMALSAFFDDAIDEGWLPERFINPMGMRPIKKMMQELKKAAAEASSVITVPFDTINAVLSSPSSKIEQIRKVKYCVEASTGCRDHELQGLTFNDLHLDEEIPYISVERQLLKRGCKPVKVYEQEVIKGVSKDELFAMPNALVSLPKKGSKRTLPLHPEAVAALRWWRDYGWRSYVGKAPAGDDPVFARSKVSLKDDQQAGDFCMMMSSEIFQEDLQRVGASSEGITFHAIRRSFADKLDELGVEQAYIDRLMGHAKKSVAQRNYIKGSLVPLYEAVCKLPIAKAVFADHTRLIQQKDAVVLPFSRKTGTA